MNTLQTLEMALEALDELMGWQTLAPAQTQRNAQQAITALRQQIALEKQQPATSHELLCVCGCTWEIKSDGSEELILTPKQPADEITKLRGEIGVLVGLLKWASLVIETVEGEDVSECEALMELQNKITYAIQGAST